MNVNFTNILQAAFSCQSSFMCLQFGFVFFWRKDFGAKAAHKMLVKLTPGASSIDCTWTLDLGIMRLVCYYCSNATIDADHLNSSLFHFLHPGASSTGCRWTLDIGMMRQVFHHCASAVDYLNASFCHFPLLVPAALVLLEPINLR